MEQITFLAPKISLTEMILFAAGIVGLLASAVLSNYADDIALYVLFSSLGALALSLIFRIFRPKVSWPLIQDYGDYAYVSRFKHFPLIGLVKTAQEKINWREVSDFKTTFYPGSQGHGLGAFWYCFERKNRSVVETFLSTEYAESVYSLVNLVKSKQHDIELTLTNVGENNVA